MKFLSSAGIALALLTAVSGVRAQDKAEGARKTAPRPWDVIWTIDPSDSDVPPRSPPSPITARLRQEGHTLYQGRCAGCHGSKGDGAGALAAKLEPRPTNFTRGVFKVRSTLSGALPTDRDLFVTLTRGLHGTHMQPWRRLSERERWALVNAIKSFSPRFAEEPSPKPLALPVAPREHKDLRDQGEILYIRMGCGRCHGDAGAGDGPAREIFARDRTRRVQPRNFVRGRFIRGAEMEDLYLTIRVGVEGTPMAAYEGLSDEEIWALAAYVRLLVRERPLPDFPPAWRPDEIAAHEDRDR